MKVINKEEKASTKVRGRFTLGRVAAGFTCLFTLAAATGLATTARPALAADEQPVVSDTVATANLYTTTPVAQKAAYGGVGTLHIHTWPGNLEENTKMYNYYVVLPPKVELANGVSGFQSAVDAYTQSKAWVHGSATVKDLGTNTNNQHVYQLTAHDGSWVEKNTQAASPNEGIDFKVVFPNRNSGLSSFTLNATDSATYMNNILWIGTGDGTLKTDSENYYPQFASNTVGLNGAADTFVRGPAPSSDDNKVPVFTINYFNPKVSDTYKVLNSSTGETIKSITKTGENGDTYSRTGLIDTLATLGLDPTVYNESTLRVDQGTLTSTETWQSQKAFSNDEEQPGKTYTVSVTPWGNFNATLHQVKQTILYTGADNNPASNEQYVTFATIHSSLTNTDVATYYQKGNVSQAPNLKYDGTLNGDQGWTKGDKTSFEAVSNPSINNYHWVSSSITTDSAQGTSAQQVTSRDTDSTITVTYSRDAVNPTNPTNPNPTQPANTSGQSSKDPSQSAMNKNTEQGRLSQTGSNVTFMAVLSTASLTLAGLVMGISSLLRKSWER